MKRKLMSILLAFSLALSPMLTAKAAPRGFTDVKPGDWFSSAVGKNKRHNRRQG